MSVFYAHGFLTDFRNGFFGYNIASFVFWLVAFICSWLIAFASLQAFLLALHRPVLPPMAVNIIFLGGLVAFIGLIIGLIVHAVSRLHMTDGVMKRVISLFEERAQTYSPETDPDAALVVSRGFQEIVAATIDYTKFLAIALKALSCALIPAALVNISGIFLVCMIRRTRKAVRSAQQESSVLDPESGTPVNVNAARHSNARTQSSARALGAAERALLVDSVFTLVYCLCTTAVGLWTATSAGLVSSGWTVVEMVFSIKDWVATLPLWALAVFQVVSTAQRSRSLPSGGRSRNVNGHRDMTTVVLTSSHAQPELEDMSERRSTPPVSPLEKPIDLINCLATPVAPRTVFDSPVTALDAVPTSRIRRNGTRLELDGERFLAVGPNVYWLGRPSATALKTLMTHLLTPSYWLAALDENVQPNPSIPSQGRVLEIMSIAQAMGSTAIRSHTLGANVGTALSIENALGQFSSRAAEAVDWAIYAAKSYGLRLIIPLTDQYDYYHGKFGGIPTFLRWRGLPADSPDDYGPFYDLESDVYKDFVDFVTTLVTRPSNLTGLTMAQEPTIMAFETGNELGGWSGKHHPPPVEWTQSIADLLKTLAPDTLVVSGTYGVRKDELGIDNIDIVSNHFYPPYSFNAKRSANQAHKGGKAFIAGEYDWTDRYYMPLIYLAVLIPAVLAALVWLLPGKWWPWRASLSKCCCCCSSRSKRRRHVIDDVHAMYGKVESTASLPLAPSSPGVEPAFTYPPSLPNLVTPVKWYGREIAIRRWHLSLFFLVLCAPLGAIIHVFMPTPLHSFLPALESLARDDKLSGSLYWSLFGKDDECCNYVQHSDGYTLHYPSDASVASARGSGDRVAELTRHAWKMRGQSPQWLGTSETVDRISLTMLPTVQCPQRNLTVPASAQNAFDVTRRRRDL
ncbi:hypothetical protein OIV83_000337 [Microbotryomycetes sp. JL201]|nr:hypothetical protein OIV83_000337 [Microbotryomycetes sp. JL201]